MNVSWIRSFRFGVFAALIVGLAACAGGESTVDTTSPATAPPASTSSTVRTTSSTSGDVGTTAAEPEAPEPSSTEAIEPLRGLAYRPVASGLDFPILLLPFPGSTDMLLAQKAGRVFRMTPDGDITEVLDIRDRVRNEGERGFLGMAIHPDDSSRVFIHYSDGAGDTIVSEFAMASDGTIDPASERVVFTAGQPAGNHNGGWIQFGPDAALYLGLGDGGGANDQFGTGRNDDTLLAGLVRIDVDSGEASKFAKGLRNPWRFWIEGDLVYVADVGQNAYEEVSVAPLTAGIDYGWSAMEGFHCFGSSSCDEEGLLLPVIEVEHGDAGTCSITGGVVYRGADIPELQGHYFFSDYCGGYLRSFLFTEAGVTDVTDWTDSVGTPGSVVSFGYDGADNLYVLTTTEVLQIVPVR